jgi:hypothetical protein
MAVVVSRAILHPREFADRLSAKTFAGREDFLIKRRLSLIRLGLRCAKRVVLVSLGECLG